MNRLNALSDKILRLFPTSTTAAADDCQSRRQYRTRLCTCGTCQDYRVCTDCVQAGTHCGPWIRCACPAC